MKSNIVILGSGESGVGAALLAQKKGFEVFVSDLGNIAEKYQKTLDAANIPYESGQHSEQRILDASEIIKSPGIPDNAPLVVAAREKGIPVISEIEFAFRYCEGKTIGITGSNGKTTTTNLIYHLLKSGGIHVGIAGNVGYSFAGLIANEAPFDWYVLELSSFQLDGIVTYRPDIAILLNITPDHLDRYDYQMINYVHSKFRIAINQAPNDLFIYNAEDPVTKENLLALPMNMRTVPIDNQFYYDNALHINEDTAFDMSNSSLKGPHNMFNAICAATAALAVGVSEHDIQDGFESFVNAPHRLEFVRNLHGVDYINDSKATNVDSVFWALKAMEKPTILIMGGVDKGNDYDAIKTLVQTKVKVIIAMGVDNSKVTTYFNGLVANVMDTNSVEMAVKTAQRLAVEGDVVLLSPACASFDLFKNYEHRGQLFKEACHDLI